MSTAPSSVVEPGVPAVSDERAPLAVLAANQPDGRTSQKRCARSRHIRRTRELRVAPRMRLTSRRTAVSLRRPAHGPPEVEREDSLQWCRARILELEQELRTERADLREHRLLVCKQHVLLQRHRAELEDSASFFEETSALIVRVGNLFQTLGISASDFQRSLFQRSESVISSR